MDPPGMNPAPRFDESDEVEAEGEQEAEQEQFMTWEERQAAQQSADEEVNAGVPGEASGGGGGGGDAGVKQEPLDKDASHEAGGFAESSEEEEEEEEEDGDGTAEEQLAFVQTLEKFFRDRSLEFKAPKFYGVELNCLKLWRAVMRLGGYEQVTSGKLWRQVGESFKPPKTCTTISWSFRGFYEKALLDYEKFTSGVPYGDDTGDASLRGADNHDGLSADVQPPGRARRDAAARAMQGWHSQRLSNGDVGDYSLKDKSSKQKRVTKTGFLKRKDGKGKYTSFDELSPAKKKTTVKGSKVSSTGVQSGLDLDVIDEGPAADWVKINVHQTRDCFEVYALVPGLLREEVRIQCEVGGRLVIAGEPEQPDNPWGVTAFRKVINLPLKIDAHQTSAVVTLHGQLFIRVPFAQTAEKGS